MSAQEAQNWRKRMYAEMGREMDEEISRGKSSYARYRTDMSKDELKAVLDFNQRDPKGAGLPTKPGLQAEIRRFLVGPAKTAKRQKVLTKGRVSDLEKLLAEVLDHTPRRWVAAKRFYRFGLTFDYEGGFPAPVYREDMHSKELRAMLELHPGAVKMSAAELKARISKEDTWSTTKPTGNKAELLARLIKELGGGGRWGLPGKTYEVVPCWEDEQEALQAKFDAEREVWQKELDSDPDVAKIAAQADKAKQKAADKNKRSEDEEKKLKLEAGRVAESRPWRAAAYDPADTTKAEMEAIWRKNHASYKLSFPYSGATIPPPEAFGQVLADWKASNSRHGHHLLAYLEVGYGTFQFNGRGQADHSYMNKQQLKEIHGRQCTCLGTSHGYAVQTMRSSVSIDAKIRFRHGL